MKRLKPTKVSIPAYVGTILCFLAGIEFLLIPDTISSIIGPTIGIVLTLNGISHIISYFATIRQMKKDGVEPGRGTDFILYSSIIMTVFGLVLGVLLVSNPNITIIILAGIFGAFLTIYGAAELFSTIVHRNIRSVLWWLVLLMNSLLFVIGVGLIINPFKGMNIVIRFCGVALILSAFERAFFKMNKNNP